MQVPVRLNLHRPLGKSITLAGMVRILILLSIVCACFATEVTAQRCQPYEPGVVTLEGIIFVKDFPGPPNYESSKKGDQRMRYWLLRLPKPICVDRGDDDINIRVANIREVQLAFADDTLYKKHIALVKKRRRFKVLGSLFHQHTGHHVRRILINVQRLDPIGS